ncbi:MAG: 4Fe-4S cluster-binding domain-containing protein [Thermofilum sp.]
MKIRKLPSGSAVYGKLPRGCELCQQGLKTVVFLTGLCPQRCFYCPLSSERKDKDVLYVNEVLSSPENLFETVLAEVLRSASMGVSITGGEPLAKPNLVTGLTRFLKDKLSRDFHVHLYTSGIPLGGKLVGDLVDSGVDEMRIHSPLHRLEKVLETVKQEGDGLSVGLEYPALPGKLDQLLLLLDIAEKRELDFIVLNELEFTETNAQSLLLRGYSMLPDYRGAQGSRETALALLEEAEKRAATVNVHFCPVSVKDSVQTSLRVYRHANLNALPYHVVTDEGTVLEVNYTLLSKVEPVAALYPRGKLPMFFADSVTEGLLSEKSLVLGGLALEEVPLRGSNSRALRGVALRKGGAEP